MHWFIAALLPQVLWSVTNYIDKYMLERYIKSSAVGALIIISGLLSFLIAPPILFFCYHEVLSFSNFEISVLILQGVLFVLCVVPYFYALEAEEPTIVVPILQTVPIFGFALAYFFLGETLSNLQCFGAMIIICSSVFLTLDFSKGRFVPKWKVLGLMLLCSFGFALSSMLFKLIAKDASLIVSIFYNQIGFILATFIFLLIKSYRMQFLLLLRENSIAILSLNALNELLSMGALFCYYYAILLAPMALVQAIGGFQPVFVFGYGVFLTLFFPRIFSENLDTRLVIQKVFAIAMICIGSWFVN